MGAATKWQDPEFLADSSSLWWPSTIGTAKPDLEDVDSLKKEVKGWKRPNDLGHDYPSLWGSLNKPVP